MNGKKLKANIFIITSVCFWGFTTVLMQVSSLYCCWQVYTFYRLAAASLALLPFMGGTFMECWKYRRRALLKGLILGASIFLRIAGVVVGMQYTTVANCSFISRLAIVLVPLYMAVTGKEKLRLPICGGIAVSLAGLVLITGMFEMKVNIGDLIAFGVALAASFDTLYVAKCAEEGDDLRELGTLQVFGATVLAGVAFVFAPDHSFIVTPYSVTIILLTGVVGTTICKVGMTIAQRYVAPAQVSYIMSLMPVFSVIGAMAIPGPDGTTETMAWSGYAGSALILLGFLLILFFSYKRPGAERLEVGAREQ